MTVWNKADARCALNRVSGRRRALERQVRSIGEPA